MRLNITEIAVREQIVFIYTQSINYCCTVLILIVNRAECVGPLEKQNLAFHWIPGHCDFEDNDNIYRFQ